VTESLLILTLIFFFIDSDSVSVGDPDPHGSVCSWGPPDPHPDPLVRGTDPRIRIRNKMSLEALPVFSMQVPAVGAGRAAVEREAQRPSLHQEEH
jgi:hypothetical protein